MKCFVLTHCAAGENYTPDVFKNKEGARRALTENYKRLLNDAPKDCIFSKEKYADYAEIIWSDDTYDKFEIFETEIIE